MNREQICIEALKKARTIIETALASAETAPKIDIRLPFDGVYNISQKFGENPSMYEKYGYAGHFGVDFLCPYGTPILATDDGICSRSGFTEGNGNFVEIDHTWGKSLYLHFASPSHIQIGDHVKKGDDIGESGNTGTVRPKPTPTAPHAGSHLHFSIKVFGVKNPAFKDFIDPIIYLPH